MNNATPALSAIPCSLGGELTDPAEKLPKIMLTSRVLAAVSHVSLHFPLLPRLGNASQVQDSTSRPVSRDMMYVVYCKKLKTARQLLLPSALLLGGMVAMAYLTLPHVFKSELLVKQLGDFWLPPSA